MILTNYKHWELVDNKHHEYKPVLTNLIDNNQYIRGDLFFNGYKWLEIDKFDVGSDGIIYILTVDRFRYSIDDIELCNHDRIKIEKYK